MSSPRTSARRARITLQLTAGAPFDLPTVLLGHGWVDLPPHRYRLGEPRFETALAVAGAAVDVHIEHRCGALSVTVLSERVLKPYDRQAIRSALRRMLRLDEDLGEFWRLCRADPPHAWVARRGAGRLLRSATVFEDLVKLLFTTNCSWAATRGMVERLVCALGRATPSGARAFPDPEPCARMSERFYRNEIRVGYRASALRRLAAAFAEGELVDLHFCDAALSTDELRRRLLALPGFGPYAAGQALRLLGRYEDLALDSWCLARLAALRNGRVPGERALAQEYERFGPFRGLALWMDLTAAWHRPKGKRARVQPLSLG